MAGIARRTTHRSVAGKKLLRPSATPRDGFKGHPDVRARPPRRPRQQEQGRKSGRPEEEEVVRPGKIRPGTRDRLVAWTMFFRVKKLGGSFARGGPARPRGEDACAETHFVTGARIVPPFPTASKGQSSGWVASGGPNGSSGRRRAFYATAVGYAGGTNADPTYEEVCSGPDRTCRGRPGRLRPRKALLRRPLETLLGKTTTPRRGCGRGNDVGTQYRSAIYAFGPRRSARPRNRAARLWARPRCSRVRARDDRVSARRPTSITPRITT